jgi:hypothetical protein
MRALCCALACLFAYAAIYAHTHPTQLTYNTPPAHHTTKD